MIEPLADGHLTTPKGYLAGATSAGIKSVPGALDLTILYSESDGAVAGVFTRNTVRSAPVDLSEARVRAGGIRAVVVNSGCANALTGAEGIADAEEMTSLVAAQLGLEPRQVAVASTGVTGVRLPMPHVRAGLPRIALSAEGGRAFAEAILTTDTHAKELAVRVTTDAGSYVVAGCAKGSGMIHPDMATMLAYVTTDAAVDRDLLDRLVRETADRSFNMVTVDGDTSCSDTLLVFANGAAGLPAIEAGTPAEATLRAALDRVCIQLAREIARDGEGASRLIQVDVVGAASEAEARQVAKTVALSSLVKTAVAGADPNWGRILVAAGRSGVPVDQARTSVALQGRVLFERGRVLPFNEAELRQLLDCGEVVIRLDLGSGAAAATAWGCDLTTEYVHINADYRT